MVKNMNISVTLTEEEVKKAVAEYVVKNTTMNNITVGKVELKLNKRLVGFGPAESEVTYFEEAVEEILPT